MKLTTMVLASSLVLVGCWESIELGGAEVPFDATLTFTVDDVRISDVDPDNGRRLVVGLAEAGPANALIRIVETGTTRTLAEVDANEDGGFAAWVPVSPDTSLSVVALRDGSRGPETELALPDTGLRAPQPALISRLDVGVNSDVVGLVGASASGAEVVVVALDTADVAVGAADNGGQFELSAGEPGDEVAVVSFLDGMASRPISLGQGADGLASAVSAGKASDTSGFVFGTRRELLPEGAVTVRLSEDAVFSSTVGEQGFGLCFPGLRANGAVDVVAAGTTGERRSTRLTPPDVGLLDVLNPTAVLSVFGGKVSLELRLQAALQHVVMVNCRTGEWTAATADDDGDVSLLADGEPGDLVGLLGIGADGSLGVAEFVHGGVAEDVSLPPSAPQDVYASAPTELVVGEGERVVLVGAAGAVRPFATVTADGQAGTVSTTATGIGSFALDVPVLDGDTPVRLFATLGEFSSEYADAPSDPDALGLVDGLVLVEAFEAGVQVSGVSRSLWEDRVVVANLATQSVSVVQSDGQRGFDTQVDGTTGDQVIVFAWSGEGGSRATMRAVSGLDAPFVVSGSGSLGCAVAPAVEGEAVPTVSVSTSDDEVGVDVVAGAGGSWWAEWTTSGVVGVTATYTGDVVRATPATNPVSVDALEVAATDGGVIVASGDSAIDAEWLVVIAADDGRTTMFRPSQAPPWTVNTDLPAVGSVHVLAWHLRTGQASACAQVQVSVDAPDPPDVVSALPDPLVIGQPFEVVGTNLDNGSVTIAGTAQAVDSTSFTTITGAVAEGTPLGLAQLVVTTLGGQDSVDVSVVSPPVIDQVEPAPLLIGLSATVTGAHFGEAPTATLDGEALTLTSGSDTELTFVVPASVAVGPTQLVVTGPWGQDQRTVNVQCVSPTVTDGPVSWILGATVELAGTGLSGATVSIGGEAQTVTQSSDSALTFVISASTPTGVQDLVVTNACGTFNQSVNVASGTPVITSTNPTPAVRLAPLNIIGDFLSGASVTIGGVDQAVTLSSKQGVTLTVAATTPLGEQTLTVTTLGGQASTSVMVASPPIVTGVAPDPVNAGSSLTIVGQHLAGATVTIGGVEQSVDVAADGAITLTVSPNTPAGEQAVVVTTDAGSTTATVEVVAPPVIDSVSPDPASTGQLITIVGQNLGGATVSIGGVTQTVTFDSPAIIQLVVDAATPLGAQSLAVSTNGGLDTATLTLIEGPGLSSVEPQPLVVGEPFTLTGASLDDGEVQVVIGGVVQTVTNVEDGVVSGVVANGTPTGDQTITLNNDNGSASLDVVVLGPPSIGSLAPTPVSTGEELTITGDGFELPADDVTVTVGGVEAEVVSVEDGVITIIVPESTPPGAQPVEVTTPAGTDTGTAIVVADPPQIESVSPDPLFFDQPVVITGTHLHGALVLVGGVPMAIQSTSYDTVVGTLGAGTPTGLGITLALSTLSGSDSALVDVSDGTPLSPPSVDSIDPTSAPIGTTITITGSALTGASVTIDGVVQSVLSSSNDELTFVLGVGTALGNQTVIVSNSLGSDTIGIEILPPAPVITSVDPSAVEVGGTVTVTGNYLGAFTSTTLGGTKQILFSTVSETVLVFTVIAGTPDGPDLPLVITTNGGTATASLTVLPPPSLPPTITDVSPQPAQYGQLVTILGDNLTDATFTVGGVPHTPITQTKSLVTFVLESSVEPGEQQVVASKTDTDSATATILITPLAPDESLVYVTAISEEGRVGVIALPGAVAPGAIVNAGYAGNLESTVADDEGGFTFLLEGVAENDVLGVSQIADGLLSDTLDRVLTEPQPDAPRTPHQFLVRAEVSDTTVEVFGPEPAFGQPDDLAFAATPSAYSFATVGTLHSDPTTGLDLQGGALGEYVLVFVAQADPLEPASAPLVTFPTVFDPPFLKSGVGPDSSVCLAGLSGTVDTSATAALFTPSGTPVLELSSTEALGPEGQMTARVLLNPAMGTGPFVWETTVDGQDLDVSVDAGLAAPPLAAALSANSTGASIEVTATGIVGEDDLLVAASSDGAAATAYGDGFGNAFVILDSTASVVWVWTVSLTGSGASACVQLTP